MPRRHVSSGSAFEQAIGYSRAVVDGDWIFVSGTTGFDYATGEISGDVLRKMTGGASPRRIALWAILIIAVIALGWMAFALARQVKPPA